MLEAAIDGVLVTDEQGRAVRWSKRFAELFDLPDNAISGADPVERAHAVTAQLANGDAFVERTREIYTDLHANTCDEIAFADGRVVERISSPIRLDHQVIGRVSFFRDITMHKHHEAALKKLSEERHQFLFEASPLPIWCSIRARSHSSPSTRRW